MLEGFRECANCAQLSYHSRELIPAIAREREWHDGNMIMLLCHECFNPTTFFVSDEDLINLKILDEQLRDYDNMLSEREMRREQLEPPPLPKLQRMFKPWALKPNHSYKDANGNEYTTDANGTLKRINKQLSKKARHRLEVQQRCAR